MTLSTIRPSVNRSARPRAALLLGSALLGSALLGSVLTGCTGSSAGDAKAARAATQAAQISAAASAGSEGATPTAVASGKVTSQEFCAALKKLQPKLNKIDSKVEAMAQLTVGLANLYDKNGAITEMDGDQMDQMASEGCPDRAVAALTSVGVKSFDDL